MLGIPDDGAHETLAGAVGVVRGPEGEGLRDVGSDVFPVGRDGLLIMGWNRGPSYGHGLLYSRELRCGVRDSDRTEAVVGFETEMEELPEVERRSSVPGPVATDDGVVVLPGTLLE